jgi:hypothetical protein
VKPTPTHHKRVRVPFTVVEHGYGGDREIRQAGPGWWQIIGADPVAHEDAKDPGYKGTIALIVAPARVSK